MSTPIRYDKPIAYTCCSCKEFFEAEDAIHDHLLGEGWLDLCPWCGSESLEDLYDVKDEEIITTEEAHERTDITEVC